MKKKVANDPVAHWLADRLLSPSHGARGPTNATCCLLVG